MRERKARKAKQWVSQNRKRTRTHTRCIPSCRRPRQFGLPPEQRFRRPVKVGIKETRHGVLNEPKHKRRIKNQGEINVRKTHWQIWWATPPAHQAQKANAVARTYEHRSFTLSWSPCFARVMSSVTLVSERRRRQNGCEGNRRGMSRHDITLDNPNEGVHNQRSIHPPHRGRANLFSTSWISLVLRCSKSCIPRQSGKREETVQSETVVVSQHTPPHKMEPIAEPGRRGAKELTNSIPHNKKPLLFTTDQPTSRAAVSADTSS